MKVNLQPATLLKKRLRHIFFPVNFEDYYKNIFFMKYLLETASERRVLRKLANRHLYYKEISWNLKLFQGADVAKGRESLQEPFHERQYYAYKQFSIYAGKKNAKSLKYFSKGILLLVKLQVCHLEINFSTDVLKYFTKVFWISYYSFKLHKHRMGFRGPKQYIFGNQF